MNGPREFVRLLMRFHPEDSPLGWMAADGSRKQQQQQMVTSTTTSCLGPALVCKSVARSKGEAA